MKRSSLIVLIAVGAVVMYVIYKNALNKGYYQGTNDEKYFSWALGN